MTRDPKRRARLLAAGGVVAAAAGAAACPSNPSGTVGEISGPSAVAIVGLSCGETAYVTGVTLAGPCAPYEVDAALSPACSLALTGSLQLRPTDAGTCRVEATFGDGTSSSAEVTFALDQGRLVAATTDVTLACHVGEGGTCPDEPSDF